MKADPLSMIQGLRSRAVIQQIGITYFAAVSINALAKPPRMSRIASSFEGWLIAVIDVARLVRRQPRS
jgi:hypothetical protein